MNNQKLSVPLNLALSSSPNEREKSMDLHVGFLPETDRWEIIVKYSGNLDEILAPFPDIEKTSLLGGYAILIVPEPFISILSQIPTIQFIEKPNRLFFSINQARASSCINPVYSPPFSLDGSGIVIGIVDSGIALNHPAFLTVDGETRVEYYWDQTGDGPAPKGYLFGTEYTKNDINTLLNNNEPLPLDISGHGTAVAGIAAGNDLSGTNFYKGIAPNSDLIVVKMKTPSPNSFPKTTELMQGVNYIVEKAIELQRPLVLNISFGNNYGSHDGSSLVETYLDEISNLWKITICVGSGNEGASRIHTSGMLQNNTPFTVELAIGESETGLNVQIWKSYIDDFDIVLYSPSGMRYGPIQPILGPQRFPISQTEILLYYGSPSPFNTSQEIYIEFLPVNTFIDYGIWNIELIPRNIVIGEFDMWLPGGGQLNENTGFLFSNPDTTLTIPSASSSVITVGAYDSATLSYADFSGRGYTRLTNQVKPDIVAPGVNILAPTPSLSYDTFTGTSFATPVVSGSVALLMQWGIVQGNDPYLYGEKAKAYLQKGATPLSVEATYPNPRLGFGALCLRDSFPV